MTTTATARKPRMTVSEDERTFVQQARIVDRARAAVERARETLAQRESELEMAKDDLSRMLNKQEAQPSLLGADK